MIASPPARTLRVEVLPRQREFLEAAERELLYSGAFGSGKTRAICLKGIIRASRPGAREGLCRKSLVALKATTLRTLLDPEGELPPVLPYGTYTHHKGDRRITLNGGGEIYYFGLDDPQKIGSLNLSGCGVDEAIELTARDWEFLLGRIRMDAPGLTRQLYAACNPSGPLHHLAIRFGLAGGGPPLPDCRSIRTRTRDNSFLPADYLESLDRFTGVARARFVEGLWAQSDRLVYDAWDPDIYRLVRPGPWARVAIGVDVGYRHASVVLALGMDSGGRKHVAEEWYESGRLASELGAAVADMAIRQRAEAVLSAPDRPDVIEEIQRALDARGADCRVQAANNDVAAGISAVREHFRLDHGEPLLTISPAAGNLIRELETYETAVGSDRPIKINDDAVDALRYAMLYFVGDGGAPPDLSRPWGSDRADRSMAAVAARGETAGAEDDEDEEAGAFGGGAEEAPW